MSFKTTKQIFLDKGIPEKLLEDCTSESELSQAMLEWRESPTHNSDKRNFRKKLEKLAKTYLIAIIPVLLESGKLNKDEEKMVRKHEKSFIKRFLHPHQFRDLDNLGDKLEKISKANLKRGKAPWGE